MNLNPTLETIAAALRKGKTAELAATFAEKVAVKVIGDDAEYVKAQAEIVMQMFLSQFPPETVTIPEVPENSHEATGTYTSMGMPFKMSMNFQEQDGTPRLNAIAFAES